MFSMIIIYINNKDKQGTSLFSRWSCYWKPCNPFAVKTNEGNSVNIIKSIG